MPIGHYLDSPAKPQAARSATWRLSVAVALHFTPSGGRRWVLNDFLEHHLTQREVGH